MSTVNLVIQKYKKHKTTERLKELERYRILSFKEINLILDLNIANNKIFVEIISESIQNIYDKKNLTINRKLRIIKFLFFIPLKSFINHNSKIKKIDNNLKIILVAH